MLKRKIYDTILNWKNTGKGTTALMIDGARRVGKSYIVKKFAENEYKSFIVIDFGNVSEEIKNVFKHDSYDLNILFQKISAFYSTILYERESLIVFDEVQQFPFARQLIKYLVEDGRYDYIETGSLIRLKKNIEDIIIPSEEEHVEMFPLDFEEFLWALGDSATIPYLKSCFENLKPVGDAVHRKVMNQFRQYILVGGMPQAVVAYLNKMNFAEADVVKRNILTLYRNDIGKFAPGYEDKVYALFDNIPAQLSRKEKKYRLSSINKDIRYRNYENAFIWLNEALIVNTCFNATDPNVGLTLSMDHTTQKCYMGDTGLLVTHTFMDSSFTENELYKSILFDKFSINEGMLIENVVAQILRFNGHKLYFYSRSDSLKRENNIEIDFLIKTAKKISPVEVKSNNYNKHKSLDKFINKFKTNIGMPYIIYTKDLMLKDNIVHLPIYMTMFL